MSLKNNLWDSPKRNVYFCKVPGSIHTSPLGKGGGGGGQDWNFPGLGDCIRPKTKEMYEAEVKFLLIEVCALGEHP